MSNLETVQNIYKAFGEGNVPFILEQLSDDINWEYQPISNDVPWLQNQQGKNNVPNFFQNLMSNVELQGFTPKNFFESGNIVITLVDIAFKVRNTGKTVSEIDEAHIWHFNAEGKVYKFKHASDTHQHYLAYKG